MKSTFYVLFLLITPFCVLAQIASGKIINEAHEPVPNASIYLLNTNTRAISDSLGQFSIRAASTGSYNAIVTAAGYADRIISVIMGEAGTALPEIILKPDYKQLSEVIVSAEKKEQSLQSVPLSISVISHKQVESFQLTTAKEISAVVANLYSANPGDNRNVISVRGIVSSSYDPAVTTYLDGINQFNLDTYIAELLDIERIEVLRGPQGTLYGRNAMGGVINIITKNPIGKFSGFAECTGGNHDFEQLKVGINAPLIKEKLTWRSAFVFKRLNGYYMNEFDSTHYDKQYGSQLQSSLKYAISSHWSAELNAKQQWNRNNGAFALELGKDHALEKPFKLNQDAVSAMVDNIFDGALNFSYVGPAFSFSSLSGFQRNYRYYKEKIDADFSPLDAIAIYNNYGRGWNYDRVLTQEFRFASPPNKHSKFSWILGTYAFHQTTPVRQSTVFGKDAKQAGIADSLFSIENFYTGKSSGQSLFGQLVFTASSKVQLVTGLRYDHENKKLSVKSYYHKETFSVPVVNDTAAKVNFHVFSPKLGLLYKANSVFNFFVNYSRGFRSGGLTPLSSDPSQPPLVPYEPEYSSNAELGMKATFGANLQDNFTVFYTRVNNAQIPVLVLPAAIIVTKNSGSLNSFGFENEITIQLPKGFVIRHNLGFTHAVFEPTEAVQGGQLVELKDKRQVFTPSLTSFFDMQYQRNLDNKKKLRLLLSAQWTFIGKQYFDIANSNSQPGYSLLNGNVSLFVGKFRFSVWGKNITDTRFVDYAYDFGAVHLGNPATYGLTAAVVF